MLREVHQVATRPSSVMDGSPAAGERPFCSSSSLWTCSARADVAEHGIADGMVMGIVGGWKTLSVGTCWWGFDGCHSLDEAGSNMMLCGSSVGLCNVVQCCVMLCDVVWYGDVDMMGVERRLKGERVMWGSF